VNPREQNPPSWWLHRQKLAQNACTVIDFVRTPPSPWWKRGRWYGVPLSRAAVAVIVHRLRHMPHRRRTTSTKISPAIPDARCAGTLPH